ncbi:hypothetical protein PCANC_02365 [Puccinia coronata f. sp. avenae]|uniref:SEC7 domain-containing protein n=1 Tax=Puccinia coronata f. sp. avenae TaxID=200324 RepID=A0A2N5VZH0_9BASI|nr:hypothetical protein PCANC_02365 [Puccinia coronata f. sp. avenae]
MVQAHESEGFQSGSTPRIDELDEDSLGCSSISSYHLCQDVPSIDHHHHHSVGLKLQRSASRIRRRVSRSLNDLLTPHESITNNQYNSPTTQQSLNQPHPLRVSPTSASPHDHHQQQQHQQQQLTPKTPTRSQIQHPPVTPILRFVRMIGNTLRTHSAAASPPPPPPSPSPPPHPQQHHPPLEQLPVEEEEQQHRLNLREIQEHSLKSILAASAQITPPSSASPPSSAHAMHHTKHSTPRQHTDPTQHSPLLSYFSIRPRSTPKPTALSINPAIAPKPPTDSVEEPAASSYRLPSPSSPVSSFSLHFRPTSSSTYPSNTHPRSSYDTTFADHEAPAELPQHPPSVSFKPAELDLKSSTTTASPCSNQDSTLKLHRSQSSGDIRLIASGFGSTPATATSSHHPVESPPQINRSSRHSITSLAALFPPHSSVAHLQQQHPASSCLPLKRIHSTPQTHHFSHTLHRLRAQSTSAHPQHTTPITHPQSPGEHDPAAAAPADAAQPSAEYTEVVHSLHHHHHPHHHHHHHHQPSAEYDHHHTTSPISLHPPAQPSAAASVSRKRSLHHASSRQLLPQLDSPPQDQFSPGPTPEHVQQAFGADATAAARKKHSRRFSHSVLVEGGGGPLRKLRNRTSTPVFVLGGDEEPKAAALSSSSRPESIKSQQQPPSTPNLFKRIKAGMTPKSSVGAASPFDRPHTAVGVGAAPSRSTLASSLRSESFGSLVVVADPPAAAASRDPRAPVSSKRRDTTGTAATTTSSRSSNDMQEVVRGFNLSTHRALYPLYRSQSDSVSPQWSSMEELRGLSTVTGSASGVTTSAGEKKSPGGKVLLRSFNTLHGTPSVSREYARAPLADSQRLSKNHISPAPAPLLHQLPHKKIRRPKTTAGARTQPLIELARKNDVARPALDYSAAPAPAAATAVKFRPLDKASSEETEEAYLTRLSTRIEKSKIPSILASSNHPFHLSALNKYMSGFEFSHDPIDLSLRKLLMVVDLPSETQQIDRVIESFSKRYTECNLKLFNSHDQVYILAFSIIMLHTDAFNKSNKAKMSRADYVKNTRMDGIPNELLEYIYDNVTYTPFVYVDPDRDISGQKITAAHQQTNDSNNGTSFFGLGSNSTSNTPALPSASSILAGAKESKSKLNPYYLIAKGSTHELRPDLGSVIPSRNPFSFTGSVSWFDFKRLRDSFNPGKAVMIQVVNLTPSKSHSIFRQIESEDSLDPASSSSLLDHPLSASLSPLRRTPAADDPSSNFPPIPAFLNLRAIKVGLVHLKLDPFVPFTTPLSNAPPNPINELSMSKNVIPKKWKMFCVLLTARQLILIKDVGLAAELQESIKLAGSRNQANPEDQLVVRITGLKPDLVLSLDGGVALMDSAYHRRPCTFRLILAKDVSLLMGVDDNDDMNSWITHINYAAAYKTHRLAFSSGHTYETSPRQSMSAGSTTTHGHKPQLAPPESRPPDRPSVDRPPSASGRASLSNHSSLAARPFDIGPSMIGESPGSSSVHSQRNSNVSSSNLPTTHWDLIKTQIMTLESQIVAAKSELNEDLRLARNLAVLTPFQISTRSRLEQAIMPVATRVRNSRCQLSRLVCYREILTRDLALGIAATNGSVKTTTSCAAVAKNHEMLVEQQQGDTGAISAVQLAESQRSGRRGSHPEEILIQHASPSRRPSEDGGGVSSSSYARRGGSWQPVKRRLSARRASDIFSGSSSACKTGLVLLQNTFSSSTANLDSSSSHQLHSPLSPLEHYRPPPDSPSSLQQTGHSSESSLAKLNGEHNNNNSSTNLRQQQRAELHPLVTNLSSQDAKPNTALSPSNTSATLPSRGLKKAVTSRPSIRSTISSTAGSQNGHGSGTTNKEQADAIQGRPQVGEEVLERMVSLRKVGRHAFDEWRPPAGSLGEHQQQHQQQLLPQLEDRSRLSASEDLHQSFSGSSWRVSRGRSGTMTSAMSGVESQHHRLSPADPGRSDSQGTSGSARGKGTTFASSRRTSVSPSSCSVPHRTSVAATPTAVLSPPPPPPLPVSSQPVVAPASSSSRPAVLPPVSSADRAAIRARMLLKAKFVAASRTPASSAAVSPPHASASGTVAGAASTSAAAIAIATATATAATPAAAATPGTGIQVADENLVPFSSTHRHSVRGSAPTMIPTSSSSSSLLRYHHELKLAPPVSASPATASPASLASSSSAAANGIRAVNATASAPGPPTFSPAALFASSKRFTQAWGLP